LAADWSRGVSYVVAGALDDRLGGIGRKRGPRKNPNAVRQRTTSLDLASLGCTPQCLGRNVEDARSVSKIEPRLNTIHGGLEDRDTMMRTQRGDTFASPT
jgi:hypothetical protein